MKSAAIKPEYQKDKGHFGTPKKKETEIYKTKQTNPTISYVHSISCA